MIRVGANQLALNLYDKAAVIGACRECMKIIETAREQKRAQIVKERQRWYYRWARKLDQWDENAIASIQHLRYVNAETILKVAQKTLSPEVALSNIEFGYIYDWYSDDPSGQQLNLVTSSPAVESRKGLRFP